MVEAHQFRLRELIGEEGLSRLLRLREEREPPSGLDSASAIDARRAELKARTFELLHELEIDPEKLRSLTGQFRDEFEHLYPDWPGDGKLATADDLFPLGSKLIPEAVPLHLAPTYFFPPFVSSDSYYEGWVESAFHFEKELFLNQQTGEVGTRLTLNNGDAGDGDLAEVEYNAWVVCDYWMPSNGRLQIVVRAECLHSGHNLILEDESGVSSAFSWQQNWLVAKAEGLSIDPWQRVLTNEWRASGDAEGHWHVHPIQAGDIWAVSFETQNWFPKDSQVKLKVGSTCWHRAHTDDMEFYSEVDFTWRIKMVKVKTIA